MILHITVETSTSESENYVTAQTQAGRHTEREYGKSTKEKKHTVSTDFERDSFLTHLKLLPTKKHFLTVTEFLGETNDAKKNFPNPFEVLCKL